MKSRKRLSSLLLTWMIMLSMVLTPLSAIAEDNEGENQDLSTPVTESVVSKAVEKSETTIKEDVEEEIEAAEVNAVAEEVTEEVTETTPSEQPEAETETKEEVESSEEPVVEEEPEEAEVVEVVEPEATPETEGVESEEIVEEVSEEAEESAASVQSMSIMPMAVIETPGHYVTDSDGTVVPAAIKGVSNNAHTLSKLVWAKGNTVYVMIQSTHELESMTLNGVKSTDMDHYKIMVSVFVDGLEYPNPSEGLKGNVKDSRWTVFKFNIADLNLDDSGEYSFSVIGIGGGHDIKGTLLFTIPKVNVTGNKAWVGGTERPSITLQLIGTSGTGSNQTTSIVRETVLGGPANSDLWTKEWLEVPKSDPVGRLYTYTVDELTVPTNYVKTINGLTVTNTYSPSQFSIDVTKTWVGPAADSVTIKLFAKGIDTGKTLVLNEGNNWFDSFKNLNQLDDKKGQKIIYTVEEVAIPNYSTVKTGSVGDGFTFINTNNEKTSIDVEKKWVGKVGGSVAVNLLANGIETGQSVTLNEDNDWKSTFLNPVRKYDATTGELINYSVVEPEVPYGYEVSYSTGENGQLIVTNTSIIGSITVEKVDENGAPLDGAIFELQDQNGNIIATGTTVDGEIQFPDLELGDYFLVETKAPDGYRKLVSKIAVTISTDDLYVVKTVENTKIDWEIPATGGIGTSLFYGIGALLMASTLILFLRRRKTKA